MLFFTTNKLNYIHLNVYFDVPTLVEITEEQVKPQNNNLRGYDYATRRHKRVHVFFPGKH